MTHFKYQKIIEPIRTSGFLFEVHLTEHCNLNCKGCSHFSPLAEKEFMDVEVFERDMARMAKLFDNNEIQRIRLLGGEPLLHPQVNEFIEIAAFYFPNIWRELVTNGLLLPDMSDSFWETCRATGTSIYISHYPVSLNYAMLEKKANKKGIGIITEPKQSFRKDVYDVSGSQDELLSHSSCFLFGNCCQLNNGRFFPCSISAYFHHFNSYFNLGISLSDDNCLDIYKARSKEEFFRLITTPVPCCKYCHVKMRKFGVKWEHSKKKIDEWT